MNHSKLPIGQQEAIIFAIENVTYVSDVMVVYEDDEPEPERRCFFLNDIQKEFLKKYLLNGIDKKYTGINKFNVMVVEFDEADEEILNISYFRLFKGGVIGARIDKHVYDLLNAQENVNEILEEDPKASIRDFIKKEVAKQVKAEKVLLNQQIEQVCKEYQFEYETEIELVFRNEYGDGITINKVSGDMWSQVDLAFELLGLDAVNDPEKVIEVEYYIREKLMQLTIQTEVTPK